MRLFQFTNYLLIPIFLAGTLAVPVRAAEVEPKPDVVSKPLVETAKVMANKATKKKIPGWIETILKNMAELQELNELEWQWIPMAVGAGVLVGGSYAAVRAVVALPTHTIGDTVRMRKAKSLAAAAEKAIVDVVVAASELDKLGRAYKPGAEKFTHHIGNYPEGAPHAGAIRFKSPLEIDAVLADPSKRKEIVANKKAREWLLKYEDFRETDKSHNNKVTSATADPLKEVKTFSEQAINRAHHGKFWGFFRDPNLNHVLMDFKVVPGQRPGSVETYWNGMRQASVENPERIGEALSLPHHKCEEALAKAVGTRYEHRHRNLVGFVAPVGWGLGAAAGYGIHRLATHFRRGEAAQEILATQHTQEQVDQTTAELTTQRVTVIAEALRTARTGKDADPELVAIYGVLRNNFRGVLGEVAKLIRSKTSARARHHANFEPVLAMIQNTSDTGNEELNTRLDLALAEAMLAKKTVKVADIIDTLLSEKYLSEIEEVLKITYMETIKKTWTLLKLADTSYPVDSETIGDAVISTVPQLKKIQAKRIQRLEAEVKKASPAKTPAATSSLDPKVSGIPSAALPTDNLGNQHASSGK